MKPLTNFTKTKIDNSYVDIVRVITIEFDGLTLNLCDRVWGEPGEECIFDGVLYEPLIVSWGDINQGYINPNDYSVELSDTSFSVDNTVPVGGADSFSTLFSVYDPHFITITIKEFSVGASSNDDAIILFKGTVEDFPEMTNAQVIITCTGFEGGLKNKFKYTIVDTDTYPDADPDALGQALAQVYGDAQRVPFRAVDAGWITTLAQDLLVSALGWVVFSDVTGLPSSGIIQIDLEQMYYSSKSNTSLYITHRGYDSTDDVEHDLGAKTAEIQTAYYYIMGHPIKSFSAVYVDDIKQDSGIYTLYTGQTGSEHGTYPGKAVIQFNTLPQITKQINVSLDDSIEVDDSISVADDLSINNSLDSNENINVSDTIGVSTGSHDHGSEDTAIAWHFDINNTSVNVLYPEQMIDGDFNSVAIFSSSGYYITLSKAVEESYSGEPKQYRACISLGSSHQGGNMRVVFKSAGVYENTPGATNKSSWYNTTDSWATLMGKTATAGCNSGASGHDLIAEVWIEIKYRPIEASPATGVSKYGSATKTGTTTLDGDVTRENDVSKVGSADKVGTVSLSGNSVSDTVIGGVVSGDLQGWQDDASGTYTGTPYALIERPDSIVRHILIDRCGFSAERINDTAYALASSFYTAQSFTLALVVLEKPNVRDLINSIAIQAKSTEVWEEGKHKLVYLESVPITDKTLNEYHINLDRVALQYTSRGEIQNILSGLYNKHWSGYDNEATSHRGAVTSKDAGSIVKFGEIQSEPYYLSFIPTNSQAQTILSRIKNDLFQPRLLVDFSGGYYLTDIERGDIIGFENSLLSTDNILEKTLLGLVEITTAQFRVIDKINYGDSNISLKTVQLKPVYQKELTGVYSIHAQAELNGIYDIYIQHEFVGQYDLLVNKELEGIYDVYIQSEINGIYTIYEPDSWGDGDTWGDDDTWYLLGRKDLTGNYSIVVEKELEGINSIHLQTEINGLYSMYLKDELTGLYSIQEIDTWADSDVFGNGDTWGAQ